jgi:hypothetical protein
VSGSLVTVPSPPAEEGLRVLQTGPLCTVQDLGRPGLARLGVGASGAADRGALRQFWEGVPGHAALRHRAGAEATIPENVRPTACAEPRVLTDAVTGPRTETEEAPARPLCRSPRRECRCRRTGCHLSRTCCPTAASIFC